LQNINANQHVHYMEERWEKNGFTQKQFEKI
jgi:hypothetical protein